MCVGVVGRDSVWSVSGMGELHLEVCLCWGKWGARLRPKRRYVCVCACVCMYEGRGGRGGGVAPLGGTSDCVMPFHARAAAAQVYTERLKREYKVACEVGKPKVNYRCAMYIDTLCFL